MSQNSQRKKTKRKEKNRRDSKCVFSFILSKENQTAKILQPKLPANQQSQYSRTQYTRIILSACKNSSIIFSIHCTVFSATFIYDNCVNRLCVHYEYARDKKKQRHFKLRQVTASLSPVNKKKKRIELKNLVAIRMQFRWNWFLSSWVFLHLFYDGISSDAFNRCENKVKFISFALPWFAKYKLYCLWHEIKNGKISRDSKIFRAMVNKVMKFHACTWLRSNVKCTLIFNAVHW